MATRRTIPKIRKGQARWPMSREEFSCRFRAYYFDPAFAASQPAIDALLDIAWEAYRDSRKAPLTRKAGAAFADPDYNLSMEWLSTRASIRKAAREHASSRARARILLICASSRNDKTCPGEMSKTYRLTRIARMTRRSS